jgi:hypothetical protein
MSIINQPLLILVNVARLGIGEIAMTQLKEFTRGIFGKVWVFE